MTKFISLDLGAESGRAMLANFDGDRLTLHEAHRFPNVPVRTLNSLHWDVLRLFDDIKHGLMSTAQSHPRDLRGVGVDTWGVDFALLDKNDQLLGNPFHYRDARTEGIMARVFEITPRDTIFAQTGVQFMEINSLYQLYALRLQHSPALDHAKTFLMMPDLFHFWLTGFKGCEFTDATTTQCFDPRSRSWAYPLLEQLGLPTAIFPQIISPATILGPLEPRLADEISLHGVSVIAPATHDTGSAVAGAPLSDDNVAWISSGTWSILGANVPAPIINAASLEFNFTNEGSADGGYRLCKNVMGLWIIQECRREWMRESGEITYAELVEQAQAAAPFRSLIDPDDPSFLRPGNMPARIGEFCIRTNQPIPATRGEFVRCALESLALKYRFQLERLEQLLGKNLPAIHMLGGGTRNQLLCQFTADAADRPVTAGPVEATTFGNIILQMLALGEITSLAQGRDLIRRSVAIKTYEPQSRSRWDEEYERFRQFVSPAQ